MALKQKGFRLRASQQGYVKDDTVRESDRFFVASQKAERIHIPARPQWPQSHANLLAIGLHAQAVHK